MKYGELNLGQIEAMVNKLGGMDGVKSLLSDECTVTIAPKTPPEPKKVLNLYGDVSVDVPKNGLDLKAFFKNRRGLYIWDDFTSRARDLLVKVSPGEAANLKSYDLGQNAYDREIKANLPEAHEVDLWVIAQMIQAQEGGKAGPLLNNGYANIFYVSGFVVGVGWRAVGRKWDVFAWSLDGRYWSAGGRVFSRN